MYKRIAVFCLVVGIIFSFSSCDTKKPKALKDKITIHSAENRIGYDIEYLGQRYNYYGVLFYATQYNEEVYENDILLSWNRVLLGYIDYYYSETDENPLFIYETRLRNIYLREDYDYKSDSFVIDGTDISFIFSQYLRESDFDYNIIRIYQDMVDVTLVSETNPRLQMKLNVFRSGESWYAGGNTDDIIFDVSEELVDLLTQSGDGSVIDKRD